MTSEQLGVAAFVFREEVKAWRIVKFDWNNYLAVRKDGTVVPFDSEDNASGHVEAEAARALIQFYHKQQAKAA